jgi:predicted nucleic acid-binding protein
MTVVLDTGILGVVTKPKHTPESLACLRWLESLVAHQHQVIVPEIADYELRRELIRASKRQGLARLDALTQVLVLPITTLAMRQAALFWATARQQGQPTALDLALDGDVILVAQTATLNTSDIVIATTMWVIFHGSYQLNCGLT